MAIDKLNQLAARMLPGGLGVADARKLVAAAGTGAAAIKSLKQVFAKFEDKFTDKGRAEFKKLVGMPDDHLPAIKKITPKTKAQILAVMKELDGNWGEKLTAWNESLVCAEVVVAKPLPHSADMPTTTAMIPIGTARPGAQYADPNTVGEFYLKRQGGLAPMTFIYGPFELAKAAGAAQVVIHQIDGGRTIEVKKGQDLVVALPSNPSTGYSWKVTRTARSFGYPVKTEYKAGQTPRAIGSGGTEELTWKTHGAFPPAGGTFPVTMEYKRGDSGKPAQTFAFTVKIV